MPEFIHYKPKAELVIDEIITIFHFEFPKNYVFQGEKHSFWEFIYVDKGELLITAGDQQYVLKAGELAFHQPDEFHDVRGDGVTAANAIVMSFTCQDAAMDFFRGKILFLDHAEKKLLSEIIREAEKAFEPLGGGFPPSAIRRKKTIPFGAEQLIRNRAEMFLIGIYRRQDGIGIRQRAVSENQGNHYEKLAADIMRILEGAVYGKISLQEIAVRVSMSQSHIKTVFKARTGDSILNTFIALKMREAKRLINESELNMTGIAGALGFESVAYFSRLFKKKTGMTPGEYSQCVKK